MPRRCGKSLPGHDRREPGAVWPDARNEGGNDLIVRPIAETGLLVRREAAADERTKPGIANPTSEPESAREKSGFPKKYLGVWQSLQLPRVTRYFPRSTSESAASASAHPPAKHDGERD
jgi:hypothetical protein